MCFQLTHFPSDDCENMCTLSYYHHHHHPSGYMNHWSLFMVRSWNNGRHCMFYYFLMLQTFKMSYQLLSTNLRYFNCCLRFHSLALAIDIYIYRQKPLLHNWPICANLVTINLSSLTLIYRQCHRHSPTSCSLYVGKSPLPGQQSQ